MQGKSNPDQYLGQVTTVIDLKHNSYVNDNIVVLPSIKIDVGQFVKWTGQVHVSNHAQAKIIHLPKLSNGFYTA